MSIACRLVFGLRHFPGDYTYQTATHISTIHGLVLPPTLSARWIFTRISRYTAQHRCHTAAWRICCWIILGQVDDDYILHLRILFYYVHVTYFCAVYMYSFKPPAPYIRILHTYTYAPAIRGIVINNARPIRRMCLFSIGGFSGLPLCTEGSLPIQK